MKIQLRINNFQYKDNKIYHSGDVLIFDETDIKTYNEAVYLPVIEEVKAVEEPKIELPENYSIKFVRGWYNIYFNAKKIKSFRKEEEALEYVNSQ